MVSAMRHLALLRGELKESEAERLWLRAERLPEGHAGVLLVTDRRLLFSGLGFLQQSQEAWPLAIVERGAGGPAELALRIAGVGVRFRAKATDVARAADLLGAEHTQLSDSLAGELERLAQLHGRGVLTDDEFAAAKRRVLG